MRRQTLVGWRGLGLFWTIVAGLLATGGGVLSVLGPPSRPLPMAPRAPVYAGNNAAWPAPRGQAGPRPIAEPDPQLQEPAPDEPGRWLPRVGPRGRRPMQVYAGASDAADARPKIALIVAGIGLSRSDSLAAMASLPEAVDLAVSAYAVDVETLLQTARRAGHEYLASVPMEPQGYPTNDEGPQALLTGATPAQNARNLEWALSRLAGYAGVTGASDGQRGEVYGGSAELIGEVQDGLARRGLFYIDPRPGADTPARGIGRAVDLVIDEPPDASEIDSRLAELEQAARQHGLAIGLVGRPSPVAVGRIAAWAAGLSAHGIALIPVSATLPEAAEAR